MRKKFILFLVFISLLQLNAQTTYYVNDSSTAGDIYCTAVGDNDNSGLIPALPKRTLQAAIDAAPAGSTIYVDKGTYNQEDGNRNILFNKAIIIIGAGTGNTIFSSHTNHRFGTISADNVHIQNLQIFDFFLAGAGQAIMVNSNVTGFRLTNINIKKNLGENTTGESIALSSGSSSTFNGLFFTCSGFNGDSGGAIKVNNATLVANNCLFFQSRDNNGIGGALELFGTSPHVTISNSTFESNIARAGGAIAQSSGTLIVNNSCFNRNYINGDSSGTTNGGGHYYSRGGIASLNATFTNCTFTGAFFCASINPSGYACEFNTNISNDGNSISLRETAGTFLFDRCLFDNSNQPQANFDNGLDFYLDKSGAISVTIHNCKFGNDMFGGTGSGGSDAINIWNTDLTNTEFVVTNSGTPQTTANQDGILGNNFSYVGTAPGGNNNSQLSDTNVICHTGITSCNFVINCANELNAPIISVCAPDVTITDCSGVLPDYRPLLSVFDDCNFTIAQSPAPGTLLSTLGNGNHTITFTVSDESPLSPDAICTMTLTLSGCDSLNFDIYASAPWMTITTTYPQIGNNVSSSHLSGWDSFLNTNSKSWGILPTHSADANAVFNISPWTARKFYSENFSSHLYNSNTLLLRGFEVKSEKWSGANICSIDAYWRVNGAGSSFTNFQQNIVQHYQDCPGGGGSFPSAGPCNNGNWQKWQSLPGNVNNNVVQNLTQLLEGNYSLEVYYQANGHNSGGSCASTTPVYDNNAGANYISTFAICPAIDSQSSINPTCPLYTNGSITLAILGYNPDQAGTFEYRKGASPWQVVGGGGASRTVSNLDAGSYEIRYTPVGAGCLVLIQSFILTNNNVGVPSIPNANSVTQPTCLISTGTFQIDGYDVANTYIFTPAVVNISASGLVTANAGSYTFTVTNAAGCISGASASILVNNIPNEPAMPIIEVSLPTCDVTGLARIINYNPSFTYIFDPLGPSIDLTNGNITGQIAYGTSYNVIASIGTLCTSQSSDSFIIENKLGPVGCTIPQGISPNKDGKNDTWNIEFLNAKRVEIFNRYGMMIYNLDNYKNEFEGISSDGQTLVDGTYFWIIYFEDKESKAGWLYINRENR
jgi:gliding motility-associated-like protein